MSKKFECKVTNGGGGIKNLRYLKRRGPKSVTPSHGGVKKCLYTKIKIFQPPTKVFMNDPLLANFELISTA